jgi:hypothetical protein
LTYGALQFWKLALEIDKYKLLPLASDLEAEYILKRSMPDFDVELYFSNFIRDALCVAHDENRDINMRRIKAFRWTMLSLATTTIFAMAATIYCIKYIRQSPTSDIKNNGTRR